MFYPKAVIFVLSAVCLFGSSCSFSQAKSDELAENAIIDKQPQPSATIKQNINTSNNNLENNLPAVANRNDSSDSDYASSYQTKPRRKKIKFSDDCQPSVVMGSDNWQLRKACGDALLTVKTDLPEKCDYNTFKDSDGSNNFSFFETAQIEFYYLSANKYLAELRCVAGAYNVQNVYVLYDESEIPAKAKVLQFPTLEITHNEDSDVAQKVEEVTTEIVGGRYFNPKTRELICFVKAHGIGDAGEYARYSFPNGEPRLEEFRARFVWSGREYTPDEVLKSPPKTWKRYYPN